VSRHKTGEQKDGIAKRGSSYSYIVRVKDPETGTSKQKWISGFATKEEAKSARDKARTDSRTGVFVAPTKITVLEHFEAWWQIKREKVKPTTAENYRFILDRYILPKLGSLPLKELNSVRIEKMLIDLIQNHSESTVRLVSIVLSQGLDRAVKDRLIAFNPAKGIERPKGKKRTVTPYTSEELKRLLGALESHRLFAFFRLLAYTGARRGEILAIRWSDLDFDKATLSISKNRTRLGKTVIEQDSTKGGEGKRIVQLDSQTIRLLKDHKIAQSKERGEEKIVRFGQDSGYIFSQEGSELPLDPSTPYHLFKKTAKRLGLRSESLHSLRHLHATELLNSGAGVHLVKDRLGHSDISTTLRIYAHVRPEQRQEIADLFAKAIENG
jgi:integrase